MRERERDYQRGVSSSTPIEENEESGKIAFVGTLQRNHSRRGVSLLPFHQQDSLSQATTDLWCATVIYGVELYQTSTL